MGIELSREQLEAAAKGPVQITDPQTGEVYVVMSQWVYAQLESAREDFDPRWAYPIMTKILDEEESTQQIARQEKQP